MIFFVRHGESEANLRGVFAGQRDNSLLTEKGREQARQTAQLIKEQGIMIDTIISSPLARALETAQIIATQLGINPNFVKIDQRITEYDMGTLSGTPIKNISSSVLASAEEAEDTEIFKQRIHEGIHELSKIPGNILLVSHAGVGRILEATREGKESKDFYDLPAWENASITKIDWINGFGLDGSAGEEN